MVWLLVTALLWGLTDPLLKLFGKGCESDALSLFANWKYLATFAANQCGSLTYIWAVQESQLSLVVPAANGLKFAFTFLMGRALGEGELDWSKALGISLIAAGVMLQIQE